MCWIIGQEFQWYPHGPWKKRKNKSNTREWSKQIKKSKEMFNFKNWWGGGAKPYGVITLEVVIRHVLFKPLVHHKRKKQNKKTFIIDEVWKE
jgi:hypothetical protein